MDLSYPFIGQWLVRNSPANRVPSHGTHLFGTAHAIDFVPVDQNGRTAPMRFGSLVKPEPPSRFPGFGREILAPTAGTIVDVHDGEVDHPAFRGLPSIRYALTQRDRAVRGWAGLAGNYVLIEAQGVIVALCHLKLGSVRVRVGQTVQAGEMLGQCGNSGNSTEPHVHVQAMDRIDAREARAVAVTFAGSLPRNTEILHL